MICPLTLASSERRLQRGICQLAWIWLKTAVRAASGWRKKSTARAEHTKQEEAVWGNSTLFLSFFFLVEALSFDDDDITEFSWSQVMVFFEFGCRSFIGVPGCWKKREISRSIVKYRDRKVPTLSSADVSAELTRES